MTLPTPHGRAARAFTIIALAVALAAGGARRAAAAPGWTAVRFQLETARGHHVLHTTEIRRDGRVVFGGDPADVDAPTVAKAPADLIDAVTAWAAKGPAAAPARPKGEYLVRVRLQGKRAREAVYPYDALPAAEKDLFTRASALINAPRTVLPCPAWDGKGDFTLTFVAQDFGVAPGPITRLTYRSSGRSTRETAGGGIGAPLRLAASTKASAAEIARIRTALIEADLGHFTHVHGGNGEGSNFRLVHLRTAAGTCGRAFTNQLPDELKPLLESLAPVAARLSK